MAQEVKTPQTYQELINNAQREVCLCGELKKKGYTFCNLCRRELSDEVKHCVTTFKIKRVENVPHHYREDFDIAIEELKALGRIKA